MARERSSRCPRCGERVLEEWEFTATGRSVVTFCVNPRCPYQTTREEKATWGGGVE